MNETSGMLQARLALIDRVRRVEHQLARGEQARIAAQIMKGFSHELGNQVQIVKLCALELARRISMMQAAPTSSSESPQRGPATASPASLAASPASTSADRSAASPASTAAPRSRIELSELLDDMSRAAEQASIVLGQMFAAARPSDRDILGPPVANTVRAAVDLARSAVASSIELRIELADTTATYATAEELEAMVFAAILDAHQANRIMLLVRERTIEGNRWVELVRVDDRHHMPDGELAHMFEPHSLLHVVAGAAKVAGGEASLAPGRTGLELCVELPVAGN